MHKKFDNKAIEKKWQQVWEESGMYNVGERDASKEKEYVLVEWPYPSGNLHIGHWHAFAVPDIYVRFQRMMGKQVLYPMGFDAFGLPAENAAIKKGVNPKEWTEGNIDFMKTQLKSMGASFSWDKTTSSTDEDYYKWTQWMFTKFYENDIAYRGKGIVNWCPGCNTVIANEQVLANSTCERSGDVIEKKEMPQWMLRITKYADRLVDDLDALAWPEQIKDAQRNWIGRREGAEITFTLSTGDTVTVFTTRPDTLYGATYLVLAPEHQLIQQNRVQISNFGEVEAYVEASKQKAEQDRLDATKEKTGVKLEGITATNPASGEEIPVYVADYVLGGYGTGAIMAVPAHDERDFEFAKKFSLSVKQVIMPHYDLSIEGVDTIERGDVVDLIIEHPTDGTFLVQREKSKSSDHVHFVGGGTEGENHAVAIGRELLEETGFSKYTYKEVPEFILTAFAYRHTKNVNQKTKSHFYYVKLDSLEQVSSEIEEGKHTIQWVPKSEVASMITWSAHLDAWNNFVGASRHTGTGALINSGEFDGMDSEEAKKAIVKNVGGKMTSTYRLRDWSIGRQRYWGVPIPIVYDPQGVAHVVPKEHLPWVLPEDVDCTPTGVAPLSKSEVLKKKTIELFGEGWTPEVETMDTFVDSSWYFLRYLDSHNDEELSSLSKQKEWMPIDMYFGGAEHTTMHLLYSRFWQKALFDLRLVTETEPYKRRINRGLILGPDGNKMSKSKRNVIDPDEHVKTVGADTVKMYLAFMGPYAETANYPWDMGGIAGIRRFLERVYGLQEHVLENEEVEVTRQLHKAIKKVTGDIALFKFNTAISAMMIFINLAEKEGLSKETYVQFIKLLSPFAPHLCEELWSALGYTASIHLEKYPIADSVLAADSEVTIGVQINGKMRGNITILKDATESTALEAARQHEAIAKYLSEEIVKIVYVPGRIINIIVKTS
jgi:leucyl-tRNA synthetase